MVELADVRFFRGSPFFFLHSILEDSLGPAVLTFLSDSSVSMDVEDVVLEGPADESDDIVRIVYNRRVIA